MRKLDQKTKEGWGGKPFHFNEVNFLSQSHEETGSKNVTYTASVAIQGTGLD